MVLNHSIRNEHGSILVTVLAVLAVLLTIFIFAMTYSLSRFSVHTKTQNRLIAANLSEAGVNRTLSEMTPGHFLNTQEPYAAPNDGSFAVTTAAWGPYLLVASDGTYANQTVRTNALVGSSLPSYGTAAITVCDEKFPLTVAGHTRIIGNVYTGAEGVTTGRIQGEGVTSDNYLTGDNIICASLEVPALDTTVLSQYFADIQTRRTNVGAGVQGSQRWTGSDTAVLLDYKAVYIENNLELNDFRLDNVDEITSIFVGGFVEITGDTKISGLVEIVADGPIYLKGRSVLDNVILYSRDSIIISQEAVFSGIAIAHNSIVVRDRASVIYPSTLLLSGPGPDDETGRGIFLSSKGRLESAVFVTLPDTASALDKYTLFLDTSAVFIGILVSQGVADIRGVVYGAIITEQFRYELPPTTYVNWVRSLYVNREYLDFSPALPILSSDSLTRGLTLLRQDRGS